jgi:hypothetical protein
MRTLMLTALWAVLTASASGTIIFNTGVNDNGLTLPSGAVDPHYTIISAPNGFGPAAFVVIDGQFPFVPFFPGDPVWLANSASSKWIGPIANGLDAIGGPPGNYTFETTFDLTLNSLRTFVVTGRLASDNASEIFLNGVDTGMGASGSGVCCFDHYTTFQITSGFVVGLNRLDFVVNNADCGPNCVNPAGLRVEFGAVPEPTTIIYVMGGLLGVSLRSIPRFATLLRRRAIQE